MSEIEEAMIHFGIDDGILSAAMEIRDRLGAMDFAPAIQRNSLPLHDCEE